MNIPVRITNRLLKHIGYRITPLSMFQLATEALIRENRQIKFIQVGANDGVRFDDLYFTVTLHRWRGIVIEPLTGMYEKLVFNYQDYNNIIPLNVGIHPYKRRVAIYHIDNKALSMYPVWFSGIASMNKDHLIRNGVIEKDIIEEEVICVTLTEVVRKYNFYNIDLLQIDTEGFDFEVIKTIDFSEFRPRLIKFEWMNLSRNDQLEVKSILTDNGYSVYVERGGSDCIAWVKNELSI